MVSNEILTVVFATAAEACEGAIGRRNNESFYEFSFPE